MSIKNRKFIRFLLDIPAVKRCENGFSTATVIKQVSVGGCLLECDESIFPGDEFRLEIELPNKNFLPLACRVIYRFDSHGVGVKFYEINRFEQDLLAEVISEKLENEGLPLLVDPFTLPPRYTEKQLLEGRTQEETQLEAAIAGEV